MVDPIRGKLPRMARGTGSPTLYDELAKIDRDLGEIYGDHDNPTRQWKALARIRRRLEDIFEGYGMEFSAFDSATTMPAWRIK